MRRVITYLIAATVIVCLIAEILLLVFVRHIHWDTRVGIPLQIIGFYGVGLVVVARSASLKEVFEFPDEMTSPNLMKFIAGNLSFLSLPVFAAQIAISSSRRKGESAALGCLGNILWIAISILIMILYVPFHVLVVMPITYLGYVMASVLFERLKYSAIDQEFEARSGQTSKHFRLRELLVSDPVAAKSFIIGIPSLTLALVVKVLALFLG